MITKGNPWMYVAYLCFEVQKAQVRALYGVDVTHQVSWDDFGAKAHWITYVKLLFDKPDYKGEAGHSPEVVAIDQEIVKLFRAELERAPFSYAP